MKRITPMLATLVDKPFSNPDWIYEIKWDGYRAVADITKGIVDLYSRNFKSFNDNYPEIVEKLQKIKENVVLDGEIVGYDENGDIGFQALQNIGQKPTRIEYMIFDILNLNGKDLTLLPLIERKKILKGFIKKYPKLKMSDYIEGEGEKFFELAVKQNLEGIMAKDKNSPYVSGRRTSYWLKMKHHRTDEAVIVGFTEPKGSRHYFGSLVLAQYKNGELVFVGHTGTGFNQKLLKDLYSKLQPLATKNSPFKTKVPLNAPVTWVKPKYVAQIRFAEWTKGNNMRQPVYLGLRVDKAPQSVSQEKEIHIDTSMKKTKEKVELTHQDKIYFPKSKITKGDVVAYYDQISNYMLPYLKDRAETLNRHPNGVTAKNFFQKNFTGEVPSFATKAKIHSESNDKDIEYLVCNNKETLLYMANLGCIEINPWNSRISKLDYPDYMIIDIDPGENTWAELVKVTKEIKKTLDESCQKSYLKTSGKSGLHIYIPLGGKYHFNEVRNFSELISRVVNNRLPGITSLERSPAKRKKKIYLDYLQNRIGQTTAAVYSLRPTLDATVSTPLKWSELTLKLDPKKFNIKTIHARLKKVGDLWKPMLKESVDLKKSILCLEKKLQ